jgi:hypothetical protein
VHSVPGGGRSGSRGYGVDTRFIAASYDRHRISARTPEQAWARRAVGEGVNSCPRADVGDPQVAVRSASMRPAPSFSFSSGDRPTALRPPFPQGRGAIDWSEWWGEMRTTPGARRCEDRARRRSIFLVSGCRPSTARRLHRRDPHAAAQLVGDEGGDRFALSPQSVPARAAPRR